MYSLVQNNGSGTDDWRLYFKELHQLISPIHDINLWSDTNIVNMVVEIPRGTQAKMEMATKEKLNPIKQDVKNGKLRFVAYPYPFNYGALPQTWEDPQFVDKNTGSLGDGDPIDSCDISSIKVQTGDVIQCKILGVWAMIDEGQTDWKILCINIQDPLASKLNSIKDINSHLPGVIDYYHTFLRDYKIPSGSKPNEFAFNGKLQTSKFALEIIAETHEQWEKAFNGERVITDELWLPQEENPYDESSYGKTHYKEEQCMIQ